MPVDAYTVVCKHATDVYTLKCHLTNIPDNTTLIKGFPDALRNLTQYITYVTIATSKLTTIPTDVFDLFDNLISLTVQADLRNITRDHLKNATKLEVLKLGLINHLPRLESSLLANLKTLKYIDFAYNDITEVGEKVFDNLPKLEFLYLEGNGIATIKNNTFVGAENLQVLDLSRNEIVVIESNAFSGLPKLKTLMLHHNRIQIVQAPIFRSLRLLTRLDLSLNEITTIEDGVFEGLDHILMVELGFNNLTILRDTTFKGATALENLYLSFNQFREIGSTFVDLVNLKLLDLSYNLIGEINSTAFSNMTKLEQIELRSTGLAQLPVDLLAQQVELRMLDLSYNNLSLTDTDFVGFQPLSKLEYLKIENTSLIGLTDELKDILPKLKFVNLAENAMDCASVHIIIDFFNNHSIEYEFGEQINVACTLLPFESPAIQAYDLSHSVFIPVQEIPNYKDPYPKPADWSGPRPGQNPGGEGGIELEKPPLIGASITNNTGITLNETQLQTELRSHPISLFSLAASIDSGAINETGYLIEMQNAQQNGFDPSQFPPGQFPFGGDQFGPPDDAPRPPLVGAPVTNNSGITLNDTQLQKELRGHSISILSLAQSIESGLINETDVLNNDNAAGTTAPPFANGPPFGQFPSGQFPSSQFGPWQPPPGVDSFGPSDDAPRPPLVGVPVTNNTGITLNDTQLQIELRGQSISLLSLAQLMGVEFNNEEEAAEMDETNGVKTEDDVKPTTYRPLYKKLTESKEGEANIAPTTYRPPFLNTKQNSTENPMDDTTRPTTYRPPFKRLNLNGGEGGDSTSIIIPTTYRPAIPFKNRTVAIAESTTTHPDPANVTEIISTTSTESSIPLNQSERHPAGKPNTHHDSSTQSTSTTTILSIQPPKSEIDDNSVEIKPEISHPIEIPNLTASESDALAPSNSINETNSAPQSIEINDTTPNQLATEYPNINYSSTPNLNGIVTTDSALSTIRALVPSQTPNSVQRRQQISRQNYLANQHNATTKTAEKVLQSRTASRGAVKYRSSSVLASSRSFVNTEEEQLTPIRNSEQVRNRGKIKFQMTS